MKGPVLAAAAATLLAFRLAGQGLEFEVASIKRNLTGPISGPQNSPGRVTPGGNPRAGQVELINVPARTLVLSAFPVRTTPVEIIGLPSWADSERYDVHARARPGSSPDELAQMWRALLADRMKLAAHYETRPRPGYNLVHARGDRALGPQLKPTDCSSPTSEPPEALLRTLSQRTPLSPDLEQAVLARCGARLTRGNTIYAGGIGLRDLTEMIIRAVDRPVLDRTALTGLYSVKLTYLQREPAAPPDDVPSIFTALQEQLGLKLESATIQGQVLVIDHIQRPSEN